MGNDGHARAGAPWVRVETGDGSWTLRSEARGETCHPRSGAWLQARERYAGPCGLREPSAGGVVRLLDVGTGLGLNLAAALEAVVTAGGRLVAVGLEVDRAPLEWTVGGGAQPPEVERWLAAVRAAIRRRLDGARGPLPLRVEGIERGTLDLRLGDARRTLAGHPGSERFDAVFLDPFSPGAESEPWDAAFLAAVAARMAPRAVLSTYTSAFRVRLRLARAGLSIGRGARVADKSSGTLATRAGCIPPLDPKTARRLARRLAEAGTTEASGAARRPAGENRLRGGGTPPRIA